MMTTRKNESTRVMTDEEVAEEITPFITAMAETLHVNPLLDQLEIEIIASVLDEEQWASASDGLPSLDLAVNYPNHLEPVEPLDLEEDG